MISNPAIRTLARFWYHGRTRLFIVFIPSYFVVLAPALLSMDLHPELVLDILAAVYVIVCAWALLDSPSQVARAISLDEEPDVVDAQ